MNTFVNHGTVAETVTITLQQGQGTFHSLTLAKGERITLVVVHEPNDSSVAEDVEISK